MGNYLSCTLATATTATTRVILPSGETRCFNSPVGAADLMLDVPNHFLANVVSLQVGRRLSPLSADEDLEMGAVYIMLPMKRLNSLVTTTNVACLFTLRHVVAAEKEKKVVKLEEFVDVDEELEMRYRVNNYKCRSKRPGLDTILEENNMIHSR